MKLRMYSVLDAKMGVFLAPFFARGDVDAARQITNACKDPNLANSPMVLSPSDFTLNCVGTFDDETGIVEPLALSSTATSLAQLLS